MGMPAMPSLTITTKGQVTLSKKLLEHLGVKADEKIAVELLPDGKASIQAEKACNSVVRLFGLLKKEGETSLSLDEIDKIIVDGWAKRR